MAIKINNLKMKHGSSKGGQSHQAHTQSSNVHNSNNPAHHAAADNKSNQMNPNNPSYSSSRQGSSQGSSHKH
ncbi:unnamed protein product [Blepharisma stoltei]|uniref:Uncharacterized protein n=1 Tax=Blepharisma stoltei TaxID=1481888 RepID=A0AAU9IM11_9CILI|nr:unnamed protein product [Blepharisma stoltei]